MTQVDNDIDVEDLDKLGPIIRSGLTILGLIIVSLITIAGFNSWRWYIAIPLGSLLFFACRLLKSFFKKEISRERVALVEAERLMNDEKGRVSYEEFSEIVPNDDDDEQIALLRARQKRINNLKPNAIIMLAAAFVMLLVGLFWYAIGLTMALIVGKIT